ncbi:MAG: hypothetical protein ACFFEV_08465 [Candidatus Thorarchaeota archaeon]
MKQFKLSSIIVTMTIVILVPFVMPCSEFSQSIDNLVDENIYSDLGLEWGVEEGANITIKISGYNESSSGVQTFERWANFTITFLFDVPTEPTLTLPITTGHCYDLDTGSQFSLDNYFYVNNYGHAFSRPAVPIGNWTYLTEVGESYTPGYGDPAIVVQDGTYWGLNASYTYYSLSVRTETNWFKSNGSLAMINLYVEEPGSWMYHVEVIADQPPIVSNGDGFPLILIVIVPVAIIATVAVVFLRRK